ncbi:MAG: hypothetical protein IKN59_07210 [Paludibacteraceae bacterium]|nr:hypothetical protein [Paludibacteraceae bacterium]
MAINDFIRHSHLRKRFRGANAVNLHVCETEKYVYVFFAFCFPNDSIWAFELDGLRPLVGKTDNFYSHRYVEQDGILFYWRDSTSVITQAFIDKLRDYGRLVNHLEDVVFELDDGHHLTYVICKSPPYKFTRGFSFPNPDAVNKYLKLFPCCE